MEINKNFFCLDLNSSIPYKRKRNLIDLITSNGGTVSFTFNKRVKYLLKDDTSMLDTYKCRKAFESDIPVVHLDYIYDLVSNNANLTSYLIQNPFNKANLQKGKVTKSKITIIEILKSQKYIFFQY